LKILEGTPISNDRANRRNDDIRAPQVRVIDAEGEQAGIMPREEALAVAQAAGMDLVEIQPNAEPPVCRVMDFGKFRFEQQKKQNAAKKKQKQTQVKEMKFRPATEEADYQVKLRAILRFLEEGDRVKINLRFRGREMAHQELGLVMLQRLEKDLEEEASIEQRPRMEGRVMNMMIAPKKR